MATYDELRQAEENSLFVGRVRAACIVAADVVRLEGAISNHANRMIWAKRVYDNPDAVTMPMVRAVIAANRAFTLVQITGAADATIQTNVTAAIDLFAGA